MLKSQGAKSKCNYGVILPGEYLQVARWWQRWCLCIQCCTWNSLGMSSPTSTRVTRRLPITRRLYRSITHRARCSSFSIPTKETIPVYSHLGAHATSVVNSSKLKIVTVTYECTEPSSAVLPLMALYVTDSSGVPSVITDSSRGSLENRYKKLL